MPKDDESPSVDTTIIDKNRQNADYQRTNYAFYAKNSFLPLFYYTLFLNYGKMINADLTILERFYA